MPFPVTTSERTCPPLAHGLPGLGKLHYRRLSRLQQVARTTPLANVRQLAHLKSDHVLWLLLLLVLLGPRVLLKDCFQPSSKKGPWKPRGQKL